MTHHLPHPGLAKLPIPRKFALGGIETEFPFPPANSDHWLLSSFCLALLSRPQYSLTLGRRQGDFSPPWSARVQCSQHCGYFDFFSPDFRTSSTFNPISKVARDNNPPSISPQCPRLFRLSNNGRTQGPRCHHAGG